MGDTPNTYWDLFLGYTVLWLLVVLALVLLQRHQAKLARELDELRK